MVQESTGIGRRKLLAGVAAGVGGTALAGVLPASSAQAADLVEAAPASAPSGAGAVPVRPSDPQYPDLVQALNVRWTARPDLVHVVDTPEAVAPVVRSAVSAGRKLTVRSGGHCFEDFVYNSGVRQIIDMTNLNRIYYDARLNAVAVEPGAILLDVYEKLYQTWGVTLPGGVCYSVGMGGHVAGGGWGWLVRRDGLIVDHLYAVEVVTVNASGQVKTIVATREPDDPNRDLWWAHTGGGGGNFGVVTRYYFRSPGARGTDVRGLLPRPPAKVIFGLVVWSFSQMTEADFDRLLRNYAEWHIANRAPDSPTRFVMGLIQAYHKSADQVVLLSQVDAGVPNAQQMLDDFLAYLQNGVVAPVFASQTAMPWLQFSKYSGTTNALLNDPTLRAEYKSAFMKKAFTPQQTATLYRHLNRSDINNPNINIVISPYGGATAAVAQSATAIPHRDATYKLLWQVQWANPADDAQNIAWARECYHEVYAATGGVPVVGDQTDGSYINYPDVDLVDPVYNRSAQPWHQLYYKGAYPRLQRVKKAYDPRNFFNHSMSVGLPS